MCRTIRERESHRVEHYVEGFHGAKTESTVGVPDRKTLDKLQDLEHGKPAGGWWGHGQDPKTPIASFDRLTEREIVELHVFFQGYFLAQIDSIDRFESVLEPEFTMIGPAGDVAEREQVLAAVRDGHGHTRALTIEISDVALLAERPGIAVARYVETHQLASRSNHRVTTAVFTDRPDLPNGVAWLHAHETWLDRGID